MKKDEFLYGALLHLGMNMWSDRPYPRPVEGGYTYEIPKTLPPEIYRLKRLARQRGGLKDFLDFEEAAFHAACDYMAAKGMNFVMIDVGEGYVYPSHPELAVKGSWTPEKMRAELKRIRGLGLEPAGLHIRKQNLRRGPGHGLGVREIPEHRGRHLVHPRVSALGG